MTQRIGSVICEMNFPDGCMVVATARRTRQKARDDTRAQTSLTSHRESPLSTPRRIFGVPTITTRSWSRIDEAAAFWKQGFHPAMDPLVTKPLFHSREPAIFKCFRSSGIRLQKHGVFFQPKGNEMAKNSKRRAWKSEDVRTLKTLAKKKTRAASIARTLKRTEGATRQKAFSLGLSLDSRS